MESNLSGQDNQLTTVLKKRNSVFNPNYKLQVIQENQNYQSNEQNLVNPQSQNSSNLSNFKRELQQLQSFGMQFAQDKEKLQEKIQKNNNVQGNQNEMPDEFNMDLPKVKSSDISEVVYYISQNQKERRKSIFQFLPSQVVNFNHTNLNQQQSIQQAQNGIPQIIKPKQQVFRSAKLNDENVKQQNQPKQIQKKESSSSIKLISLGEKKQEEIKLQNLYNICNYVSFIKENQFQLKLVGINVEFQGPNNIEQDPLLYENPQIKIVVLEMIFQAIKNHSKTIQQNMLEISQNYRVKNIGQFCKYIKNLCQFFISIGCIRCYYVCKKMLEFQIEEEMRQKKNNRQMIIDIDVLNGIWILYPALIEYIIQFITYMDFEFLSLINKNENEKDKKMNDNLFIQLLEFFPINEQFKLSEKNGIIYCLYNSDQDEYFESINDRCQTLMSSHFTPQAFINEAKQTMAQYEKQRQSQKIPGYEILYQSNILNLSVYELLQKDQISYHLKEFYISNNNDEFKNIQYVIENVKYEKNQQIIKKQESIVEENTDQSEKKQQNKRMKSFSGIVMDHLSSKKLDENKIVKNYEYFKKSVGQLSLSNSKDQDINHFDDILNCDDHQSVSIHSQSDNSHKSYHQNASDNIQSLDQITELKTPSMLDLNNISFQQKNDQIRSNEKIENNDFKNTILPSTSEISILEKLKRGQITENEYMQHLQQTSQMESNCILTQIFVKCGEYCSEKKDANMSEVERKIKVSIQQGNQIGEISQYVQTLKKDKKSAQSSCNIF